MSSCGFADEKGGVAKWDDSYHRYTAIGLMYAWHMKVNGKWCLKLNFKFIKELKKYYFWFDFSRRISF